MDHRLREIEQWVAEAREDLGDGGQEAYLQKLYLLDAEIRAVIRENGVVPSAYSPVRTTDSVRRQSTRALALGGSALVALLTAATVLSLTTGTPAFLSALRPQGSGSSVHPMAGQAVPLGSRMVLAGRSADSGLVWQGLSAGSLEEELPEMPGETMMVFEEEATLPQLEPVTAQPAVMLASASPAPRTVPQTIAGSAPAAGRETGREPAAQPASTETPRMVEVLPAAMLPPAEKEAVAEKANEKSSDAVLDAARIREDLKRSLGG